MSWLNFNEGLNLGNLKGQLTTLAGNVLQNINDGTASVVSNLIEDEPPQSSGQSEAHHVIPETSTNEEDTTKIANHEKLVHLKNIIHNLEKEKEDYLNTLKQLDSEYQENIIELANSKKELESKYKDAMSELETQRYELDSVHFKLTEESSLRISYEKKYHEKLIENQQLQCQITDLKSKVESLQRDVPNSQKPVASVILQEAPILQTASCDYCSKSIVQDDESTQTDEMLMMNDSSQKVTEGSNNLNDQNASETRQNAANIEKTHLLHELENQIHNLVKFSKHLTVDPGKHDQIDQIVSKLEKNDIGQLELLFKKLIKNTDNLPSSERETLATKQENLLTDLNIENDVLESQVERLEKEHEIHLQKVTNEYTDKLEESISTCERLRSELDIVKDELLVAIETHKQLQDFAEQIEDKYQRSKLEETALKLQNDHLRNELNATSDKKQNTLKEMLKCIQSFSDNISEHIENSLQNNVIEGQFRIEDLVGQSENSSLSGENVENPVLLIKKQLEIFSNFVNAIMRHMNELNCNCRSLKEENNDLKDNLAKIFEFAYSKGIIDELPASSDENSRNESTEILCQKMDSCLNKYEISDDIIQEVEDLKIKEQKFMQQYQSLSTGLLEEQTKNKVLVEEKIKMLDYVRTNNHQNIEFVKQFGIFENYNDFKDLVKNVEEETSQEELCENSFTSFEKHLTISTKLFQIIFAYLRNLCLAYENLAKEKESLGRNMGFILEVATKLSLIEKPGGVSEVRPLDDLVKNICEKLNAVVLSKKSEETETSHEKERLKEENEQLRETCARLSSTLLQEQSNIQHLATERSKLMEQEATLTKKLERLQTHLIEVEEHYTKELVEAEEKQTVLQQKLREIEQSERDSNNLYKSVNIRANQKLEALQSQAQLLIKERDDLKKKLAEAEIHYEENVAAMKNLHKVLDQFQKDRDLQIRLESDRIRKEIAVEKIIQEELKKEIVTLKQQLEQSKQGLHAASRLSDQLESSQQHISVLKDEISELKQRLAETEKLNSAPSKKSEVEKTLLKNLVISAFAYNKDINENQSQILRIIGHVLNFTEEDNKRLSQKESQGSWSKLFSMPMKNQDHETLTQQFVKFLEMESKPRDIPPFSEVAETSKPTVEKKAQSSSILSDISLPTFGNFSEIRSSSSILKDVLKETH